MAKNFSPVISVQNLDAGYGHVTVIRNGSIEIRSGEVVGLVGRNGAGKTTFISAVAGLVKSTAGTVTVSGKDITSLPASKRVGAGLAIVPSGGRLFKSLTVRENLTIGSPSENREDLEKVFKLFPELQRLLTRYAGKLSGGERQMVAIGRALMLRPRLLLMDEPSEGLAPVVVLRVAQAIHALREAGVGILLAEQNAKFTDLVCQRWYSIDKGVIADLHRESSDGSSVALA